MMLTKEEMVGLESQIAYKIYNSRTNAYPFPHCQIENFLPGDLIGSVLNFWPNHEEFSTNRDSGNVVSDGGDKPSKDHPSNFRYQIGLTNKKAIDEIKGQRHEFWMSFTRLLCSRKIINSFVALYAPSLVNRFKLKNFNELFQKMEYNPRIHLIHDKTNYALGPHTDHNGKVIVILIYFESDLEEGKNSLGTSIYIPKEPGFLCSKGTHHNHEDFIRVFSANFKKNNAFSFCRSDKSFHGVEKVQRKSVERKLLQYSIYGHLK